MTTWRMLSLVAATLTMGLMAGLFYAYAISVMTGLAKTDDRTFVDAMQRINVAIVNGWFVPVFAGALLLTALTAALHLRGDWRPVVPWIVAALGCYLLVLVVTMAVNVPLNDRLADAGDPARIADLHAVRHHFEAQWVRFNILRAVASTAAFGCLTWGMLLHGRISGGQ